VFESHALFREKKIHLEFQEPIRSAIRFDHLASVLGAKKNWVTMSLTPQVVLSPAGRRFAFLLRNMDSPWPIFDSYLCILKMKRPDLV
jgi:hypothetical protein